MVRIMCWRRRQFFSLLFQSMLIPKCHGRETEGEDPFEEEDEERGRSEMISRLHEKYGDRLHSRKSVVVITGGWWDNTKHLSPQNVGTEWNLNHLWAAVVSCDADKFTSCSCLSHSQKHSGFREVLGITGFLCISRAAGLKDVQITFLWKNVKVSVTLKHVRTLNYSWQKQLNWYNRILVWLRLNWINGLRLFHVDSDNVLSWLLT